MQFSTSSHHFIVLREAGADVYSPTGVKLYSADLPLGSKALLSADGRYLLAFRERNPADPNVEFFDSTGSKVWQMRVDGAVWCADGSASEKGARFLVGTSKGSVYVIDLVGRRRRYRKWRMPGAVVSLSADPKGDCVYAASWQDAFVRSATIRGRTRWQVEMEPAELHSVRALPKSQRVLVCSEPVNPEEDGFYALLGPDGRAAITGELRVKERPRIVTAPNGEFVCLGISKMIRHKRASMLERHAQLFRQSDGLLWEKGSPFFCAVPVAVTDKGCAIISDGKTGVFLVSPSGEMRPSLKLDSPVREFFVSDDGSRLLALCCDRQLVLINVSQ